MKWCHSQKEVRFDDDKDGEQWVRETLKLAEDRANRRMGRKSVKSSSGEA